MPKTSYLHRIVGAYDEARTGSGAKVPAKLRALLTAVDQATPAGYNLSPYLSAGVTPTVDVLRPWERTAVVSVSETLTIMQSLDLEALPPIGRKELAAAMGLGGTEAHAAAVAIDRLPPEEGEDRIGTPVAGKRDKRTPISDKKAPAADKKPATKASRALALISRKRGATTAELTALTGWLPHTLRAFIAVDLRRKAGVAVIADRTTGTTTYRVAPPQKGQANTPCGASAAFV